jgi:hypothetical protein
MKIICILADGAAGRRIKVRATKVTKLARETLA